MRKTTMAGRLRALAEWTLGLGLQPDDVVCLRLHPYAAPEMGPECQLEMDAFRALEMRGMLEDVRHEMDDTHFHSSGWNGEVAVRACETRR